MPDDQGRALTKFQHEAVRECGPGGRARGTEESNSFDEATPGASH